jgi:hypothetical protein
VFKKGETYAFLRTSRESLRRIVGAIDFERRLRSSKPVIAYGRRCERDFLVVSNIILRGICSSKGPIVKRSCETL